MGACEGNVVEGDEEERVDQKQAMFNDPIIGHEAVVLDEHGPGARAAEPLPTPREMSAAEWAEHCLTHLKYHRVVLYVLGVDGPTLITGLHTSINVPYPCWWETSVSRNQAQMVRLPLSS